MSGHRGHAIAMKDNIQKRTSRFLAESGQMVTELESRLMEHLGQKELVLQSDKRRLVQEIEVRFEGLVECVDLLKKEKLAEVEREFGNMKGDLEDVRDKMDKVKKLLTESQKKGNCVATQLGNKREIEKLVGFLRRKNEEIVDQKANLGIVPKVKLTRSLEKIFKNG